MKLRFAAVVLSVIGGCVVSGIAGGSSAGGGAQIAPTDGGSASTYKSTTSSIPGGNAYDSAGVAGNQSGGSASTGTSAGSGTTGNSASGSSFGNGSPNGSAFSGPSGTSTNPARANADAAAALKREKVVDTGDKHFETNPTTNSQSKDKTFGGGLLDTANDISAVGKGREQVVTEKSADVKPKTAANDNGDPDRKK